MRPNEPPDSPVQEIVDELARHLDDVHLDAD